MENNKIELKVIESLLDNESSRLLSKTNIRRLGGRKKDGKVEQIFECVEGRKLYVKSEELKKLLCFISYKESFPEKDLLEISKNFNKSLKDSSIDIFMGIYIKEKNKINDQLLNILVKVNENNNNLEDVLKKYIEILYFKRKSSKEISEIEEMKSNKREEMHAEFFLNYENKIFKYLEIENINESIYSIIENIQKNKFSENKDLNSKLLSPYKENFVKLEEFILNQKFNTSTIQVECKSVLDNFISSIKQELIERFEEIKILKLKLDYRKIINDIKPIQNKLEKLIDEDRFNRKKEGNIFDVPKNEKEDSFNCLDELIAFYSSENGIFLDKIFKNNQIILKLFNLLISNDFLQEGKHIFLNEFKIDEIYSFEEDFKSIRLENTIFYPGYNFYFNEHLINDIYKVLGSKDSNEQDRLISYVEKIIPYITVGLDSNLSKVYEHAVYSGNSKAVKVLNGYLNNFEPNDLRILTEGEYSNETILNSIDLLEDINLKGYYKYIYNGNYKTLKTLYEDNINSLNEDNYTLEMNFCLKGKKAVETSKVIFDESKKHHIDHEQFKLRFLNVASVLNNKEVLEENLEFLKEQSSKSEEINELLAYCLNNNMIDVFSKIYSHEQFDMYKIFMKFYTFSPNITKDPKIWEFIVNDIFKELNINKEINRKIVFDPFELDEENPLSYLNNMGSAIENEFSIALYIADNFFPKGTSNFNFYTFGKYNLTFLDKLRKESKHYKQEFQAMYEILTCKVKKSEKTKELNPGDEFEILYTTSKKEEFLVACKIIKNYEEVEILSLKTNSHKNVNGGLKIVNSMDEAQKMVSEIALKNNTECLLAAIKNKDTKEVKSILNGIIDINREDENGMSPLIGACVLRSKDIVELLLLNKANPNKMINSGQFKGHFPLILATENKDLNIVKLLIKNGADINLKYSNGCTSLILASQLGHDGITKFLLENDANVNLKKDDGVTALELASELGHEKIVNLLIKNHANINVQTNAGFTPLMMAAQMEKEKIVKILLEKEANPNIKSNQGSTALMLASVSNSKIIMEHLLEKEIDIEIKSQVLILASENGQKEILELLIEKGANINFKMDTGATPLIMAVQTGREEIVKLLIEKEVEINTKTNEGTSPLIMAAHMGHSKIVKLLLEKGCYVDMNNNNWTSSAMDFINKSPELYHYFLEN